MCTFIRALGRRIGDLDLRGRVVVWSLALEVELILVGWFQYNLEVASEVQRF